MNICDFISKIAEAGPDEGRGEHVKGICKCEISDNLLLELSRIKLPSEVLEKFYVRSFLSQHEANPALYGNYLFFVLSHFGLILVDFLPYESGLANPALLVAEGSHPVIAPALNGYLKHIKTLSIVDSSGEKDAGDLVSFERFFRDPPEHDVPLAIIDGDAQIDAMLPHLLSYKGFPRNAIAILRGSLERLAKFQGQITKIIPTASLRLSEVSAGPGSTLRVAVLNSFGKTDCRNSNIAVVPSARDFIFSLDDSFTAFFDNPLVPERMVESFADVPPEKDCTVLVQPGRVMPRSEITFHGNVEALSVEWRQQISVPTMVVSEVYCARYHDALANGYAIIVTADGGVAAESFLSTLPAGSQSFYRHDLMIRYPGASELRQMPFVDTRVVQMLNESQCRISKPTGPVQRVREPAFFLNSLYYGNYAHWSFDLLARKIIADKIGLKDVKFVLPLRTKPYQKTMHVLAGIEFNNIVYLDMEDWLQFDQLYVPSRLARFYDYIAPEAVEFLASYVHVLADTGPLGPRRVYVNRKDRPGRRELVNETEVERALAALGFVSVCPGELSFEEEVRTFANAECVVGAIGTGLYNQVFMPNGSKVMMISAPGLVRAANAFRNVAVHKQQDLALFIGESFDMGRADLERWVVDVPKLVQAIEAMLGT